MHKIRRQAHRYGWTDAPFNPFRRVRSNDRRPDDLEEGSPNALVAVTSGHSVGQAGDESPRSPTRIETEKEENISSSTVVGGGVVEASKSVADTEVEPTTIPLSQRTESESEEERVKRRKELLKKPIPVVQQIRVVLFPSWYTINWLLFAAPVGIAIYFINVNPLAVFIVNFLAIIPLAGILSFATEELALRVGETIGGLLNASFGNAVELIIGIVALVHRNIPIVRYSLIGSMLSNLLIVLGMCFFFGGLNRVEQFFNVTVAQTASSLLALSIGSLIIPTGFTWNGVIDPSKTDIDEELSRGTAVILLVVYGAYLYFQLASHKDMYNAPSPSGTKRRQSKKESGDTFKALVGIGEHLAGSAGGETSQQSHVRVPDSEPEEPSLSFIGSLITLGVATALIGVCADFLIDSINTVTCTYHVSETFIGLILLPIVGNAAEHATAVTVAVKDKMDLAIGVAVGSSMQIALFVLPLMVILGWIIGADMTLIFDDFQIALLFLTVILVNYLIGDGKSHWLEGVLLMALYLLIAVAAWYYPLKVAGEC